MADSSQEPPVSPYRQDTDPGPRLGTVRTCELCERRKRCFARYGLAACRACHRDLLPAKGML